MIETLYGIQVTDSEGYAAYREKMMPLLASTGGQFVVDLWIESVLRAPGGAPMNRVFSIRFPSEAAADAFFADPVYLEVRRQYFAPSVASVTVLGRYEVLDGAVR
jgi:uncharacterized protein (DUF1330 family)